MASPAGDRRCVDRARDLGVVPVMNGDAFGRQHRAVAVFQIEDLVGQRGQRDGVRAEIHLARVLAGADADGQRAAPPRRDHQVVNAGEDDAERERPFEPFQHGGDGVRRAAPQFQFQGNQVNDDFGVGVRRQRMPGGFQFVAQALEILDDAVVHQGDAAGGVGVGVFFVGHAVGRPAGVADAGGPGNRLVLEAPGQVIELAFGAAAFDAAGNKSGDAGRIIAPVFEPLERIEQWLRGGLFADDADNAAHGS